MSSCGSKHGRPCKTLSLIITRKCNLNCEICYVYDNEYENAGAPSNGYRDELSLFEINSLLQEAKFLKFNRLHIYGGEPFLSKDLKNVVLKARELDFMVDIATNFALLAPTDIDWIKNNDVSLAISFNFWDLTGYYLEKRNDSKYNLLSKKSEDFSRKLELLDKIIEKEIPFTVITVLTKENYLSYDSFLNFMSNRGVRNFWANYFSLLGRGKNLNNIAIEGKSWHDFIKRMEDKYYTHEKINLRIEGSFVSDEDFVPFETDCYLYDHQKIMVDSNGDIYPCLLLVNQKKWILGNFREKGLDFSLRNLTKEWIEERWKLSEECRFCNKYAECRGGCPAYQRSEFELDYRCAGRDPKFRPICPLMTLF